MKSKILILIFSYLFISHTGCNEKDIQPVFPPDLPGDKKEAFVQRWTEGKELFKDNCVKCHGVFNKSKDTIPDFSEKQIQSYGALFIARDAKNHAVMQQVSSEDFYRLLIFITYIKRQGTDSIPPPLYIMRKNVPYGIMPADGI